MEFVASLTYIMLPSYIMLQAWGCYRLSFLNVLFLGRLVDALCLRMLCVSITCTGMRMSAFYHCHPWRRGRHWRLGSVTSSLVSQSCQHSGVTDRSGNGELRRASGPASTVMCRKASICVPRGVIWEAPPQAHTCPVSLFPLEPS